MPAVASAGPCSACVEHLTLAFAELVKEHRFGHPGVVHARDMAGPAEVSL